MLKKLALFYIFVSVPCHSHKPIDYKYNQNLYEHDDYWHPVIMGAAMTCTLPLLWLMPPPGMKPMNDHIFVASTGIFLIIFDMYCYCLYQKKLQYWDQFYQTKSSKSLNLILPSLAHTKKQNLIQDFILDLNNYTEPSNVEKTLQNGLLLTDTQPVLMQAIINELNCDCVYLSWRYFLGTYKKQFNYYAEEGWDSQSRVHRFFERIRQNNIKKNRSCLIIITDFDSLNDNFCITSFDSQQIQSQIQKLANYQINNIALQIIHEMTNNNTQSNQNFIIVAGLISCDVSNINKNFKSIGMFSTII